MFFVVCLGFPNRFAWFSIRAFGLFSFFLFAQSIRRLAESFVPGSIAMNYSGVNAGVVQEYKKAREMYRLASAYAEHIEGKTADDVRSEATDRMIALQKEHPGLL